MLGNIYTRTATATSRLIAVAILAAAPLVAATQSAGAQEFKPLPPIEQPAPQAQNEPPQAPVQKPAGKSTPKAAAAGATAGGDAALRQRVEQLEEQIVDMQVVIGTLESLAKTSGSATASPQAVRNANAPSGTDSARVSSLEAQVQALSQQVQQLQNGKTGAIGAAPQFPGQIQGNAAQGPIAAAPDNFPATTAAPSGGFADNSDPIGGLIANAPSTTDGTVAAGTAVAAAGAVVQQPLPPVGGTAPGVNSSADAKQLYESAYGSLLNQNYTAAQAGFQDFLRRFPKENLAPDALFWLGESHYMQRNYNDAAEAFDLVASAYSQSAKAPEAQLRRAATLVQLGRKDDACAALKTLNNKYPNARAVLKTKADAERQRAGCA